MGFNKKTAAVLGVISCIGSGSLILGWLVVTSILLSIMLKSEQGNQDPALFLFFVIGILITFIDIFVLAAVIKVSVALKKGYTSDLHKGLLKAVVIILPIFNGPPGILVTIPIFIILVNWRNLKGWTEVFPMAPNPPFLILED